MNNSDLYAHTTRMENHDYKDTIEQATGVPEEENAEIEREKRRDAEMAFEAMAVASSMGMYGQQDDVAGLIQLELTQEMLYNLEHPNESEEDERFE